MHSTVGRNAFKLPEILIATCRERPLEESFEPVSRRALSQVSLPPGA